MARKFRVDRVDVSSLCYVEQLDKYVGQILEFRGDDEGRVSLYTPNKDDYWYFEPEWVTEVFEDKINKPQMVEKKSALDVQEGGGHYKSKGIQPVEYAYRNNLGFIESNVVKYVSRWKEKNGIQDLKKARHYLDILIEFEEQKEEK